jgi:hypothetical protein
MRLIPTTIDVAFSQNRCSIADYGPGTQRILYKRDKRGSLDRDRLSG